MFLFGCCQTMEDDHIYETRDRNHNNEVLTKRYSTLAEIDHQRMDSKTQVLKMKKSGYQ